MQNVKFDYEIVIGDDCSDDETFKILLRYQNEHPEKIKILRSTRNIGARQNSERNRLNCRGKYVALCEGDDFWIDTNKLQRQINFLEENAEYAVCSTNTKVCKNNNTDYKSLITTSKSTLTIEDLFVKNYLPTQTVVFRNYLFKPIDDFKKLSIGDWPLHVLNTQYGKIRHMAEQTAVYRLHDTNIWQAKSFIHKLTRLTEATEFLYRHLQPQYKALAKKKLIKSYYSLVSHLLQKGDDAKAKEYYDKFIELPGARYTKEYLKIIIKMNSKRSTGEIQRN